MKIISRKISNEHFFLSYLEMNLQYGVWFSSTWTLDTETVYLFKSIYDEICYRYASSADLKSSFSCFELWSNLFSLIFCQVVA